MSYMWKITMSSGGGTVRTFASGLSKEEAEEIAAGYGWEFVDENGFAWALDVEEDD